VSLDPYYADESVTLYHGDCREVLLSLPDASVDAVVTDPPYELGFMGKGWDASGIAYEVALWRDALRVLKPGGHLLAFGGTRTWHRLACAIEDAGFEVRDSIAWMYGSGFPKSLDVSKAIDKAAGVEREEGVPGPYVNRRPRAKVAATNSYSDGVGEASSALITAPATPAAQQWQGWGTALKPAFEPIVVARKPLIGTVAANVLKHGTGALNVDGCRIAASDPFGGGAKATSGFVDGYEGDGWTPGNDKGRWPANVILDESQAAELDRQSGVTSSTQASSSRPLQRQDNEVYGKGLGSIDPDNTYADTGGASRFFYTAKADSSERPRVNGVAHPTVKPLDLMRYLVRLVTPPGGVVLEPFAGSGTTLEAAVIEGFRAIGIERETDYLPLITQRLTKPLAPVMF
jgi:DNA methylase